MNHELEIEIIDPIDRHEKMAIEVAVVVDSEIRYCYFATPEGLKNFGDWVPGTEVRMHYDDNDFIVVSEISKEIIESAIIAIHKEGRLYACTSASS
ncbi:MAG: hypothetical protein COB04_18800 [Gammaproteobacteria bacterium]|nr:MAG: hypothetical protein COB04_18800 [Gammaproteobacteria bacterium]